MVGVPLIVKTPAANDPVTPAGKTEEDALVAVPPTAYVIFVIAELTQTVWEVVAGAEVNVNVGSVTVIVPLKLTCGVQAPPEVVTV